jgi:hypothetical protein
MACLHHLSITGGSDRAPLAERSPLQSSKVRKSAA